MLIYRMAPMKENHDADHFVMSLSTSHFPHSLSHPVARDSQKQFQYHRYKLSKLSGPATTVTCWVPPSLAQEKSIPEIFVLIIFGNWV